MCDIRKKILKDVRNGVYKDPVNGVTNLRRDLCILMSQFPVELCDRAFTLAKEWSTDYGTDYAVLVEKFIRIAELMDAAYDEGFVHGREQCSG